MVSERSPPESARRSSTPLVEPLTVTLTRISRSSWLTITWPEWLRKRR